MKEYAREFYKSNAWIKASRLYMSERHYICERCGGAASICHHRQYIRPDNIGDTDITLNPENLECLCQDCHNKEHHRDNRPAVFNGATFDENGNPVKTPNAIIVCGAPGSGKSTYVQQNKADTDIVFDLDHICAALMGNDDIHGNHEAVLNVALELREAFYNCVEQHKGKWAKAWIITSMSDRSMLDLLAFRLKADVMMMPTTIDECIDRISNDATRSNKLFHIQLAEKWYKDASRPVLDPPGCPI